MLKKTHKIFLEMYDVVLDISFDRYQEYNYVLKKYGSFIAKSNKSIYSISSINDVSLFEKCSNLQFSEYKMFRCCKGGISFFDKYHVIRCNEVLKNYYLLVSVIDKQIIIVSNNAKNEQDSFRFLFNIINETFSVLSYFYGYRKIHAACLSVDNKGVLLIGEKASGKTTLLMSLLENNATFINSDITRIANKNGIKLFSWVEKVNIGKMTVLDNDWLFNILSKNRKLQLEYYNCETDKYEYYRDDFLSLINCENINDIELYTIVKPHFSLDTKECRIIETVDFFSDKYLSPICGSWLPIVDEKLLDFFDNVDIFSSNINVRIIDFYFGDSSTNPGEVLMNYLKG